MGVSLTFSGSAAAVGVPEASATAKGTVGGALLGAEAVTFATALFDVKPTWVYLLGGGLGAVGGGVGGYFLEDSLGARGSMWMLAAGMVLAIPTTVFVLNTAAYDPPADYIHDTRPPAASGSEQSQAPSSERRLALRTAPRPALPSLVGMDQGTWTLGVPAIALLDVYSPELRRTYNLQQETELRVPVLAMRF